MDNLDIVTYLQNLGQLVPGYNPYEEVPAIPPGPMPVPGMGENIPKNLWSGIGSYRGIPTGAGVNPRAIANVLGFINSLNTPGNPLSDQKAADKLTSSAPPTSPSKGKSGGGGGGSATPPPPPPPNPGWTVAPGGHPMFVDLNTGTPLDAPVTTVGEQKNIVKGIGGPGANLAPDALTNFNATLPSYAQQMLVNKPGDRYTLDALKALGMGVGQNMAPAPSTPLAPTPPMDTPVTVTKNLGRGNRGGPMAAPMMRGPMPSGGGNPWALAGGKLAFRGQGPTPLLSLEEQKRMRQMLGGR